MRWRQGCFERKFARISIAEGRDTLPPRALIVDNRLSFESPESPPVVFSWENVFLRRSVCASCETIPERRREKEADAGNYRD